MSIYICVIGASGRMGINNLTLINQHPDLSISGAIDINSSLNYGRKISQLIDIKNSEIVISDNIDNVIDKTDVFVDFSSPKATLKYLDVAIKNNKKYIIGTTGFSEEEIETIKEYSKKSAIILSSNFSKGITVLNHIIKSAVGLLKDGYDIEMVEAHHKRKKDAPSGTAIKLAKTACEAKNIDFNKDVVYGREGIIGERKENEFGVFALRAGGIIGEHKLYIVSDDEKVELSHTAFSRKAFSSGVISGILFLSNKDSGLFDMEDILGIK